MAYGRSPILGVKPSQADTDPEFDLGTRAEVDGVKYVYCQANGAVATQLPVAFTSGYQAAASGNAGTVEGVSVTALADNEYGWIAIQGEVTCNVAGSTAANAVLAILSDANGDMVTVAAGTNGRRGKAMTAESGGLATVLLD